MDRDGKIPHFLQGGGAMGARMRAHDWSASPLGDPDTWPRSLGCIVALMLGSRFPMFLAWGPDLGFLYNDAYSQMLGTKHPDALGRPFKAIWYEIWDDILPFVETALDGRATWFENLPFVMHRHGHDEQTHFTFSYSPAFDDDGRIVGMFCACTETTRQVRAEKHRDALMRLEERLRDVPTLAGLTFAAAELLGETLGVMRVGYGVIDATAGTIAVERVWSAPGFAGLAGIHRFSKYGSYIDDLRRGEAVAIGDVETDPRTASTADAMRAIGIRACLDVPVVEEGRAVAEVFVHSATPRPWMDEEIAFVRDFADRTHAVIGRRRAEQEVRDSRARLGTALAVARLGTFEWDLRTDAVGMDEGAREILGLSPAGIASARELLDLVDPADVSRVRSQALASREALSRLEIEYRIVRPDGTRRTIVSISDAVVGLDGKADRRVGVFDDVTVRRRSESRRDALVELGNVIRDLEAPSDLVLAAAGILGRTLDVARVGYGTVDHDSETLEIERDWTAPDVVSLAGLVPLRNYGSFVDTLKQGEMAVIVDVREDPRTASAAPELERLDASSFVNVPIVERGRLVALLFVNDDAVRLWERDDLDLIREFADRLRAAVERSRNADALRISEANLRELNETLESEVAQRTDERDRLWSLSEDMLARADLTGMMTAVSPAWTRVLGWSQAELLERPYASFMHPDDEGPTLGALVRMGETGRPTRFENRIATSTGGWKPIEWTVAPEEDGVNFIAVGRDLSDVKAKEGELAAAQEALRQSQKMEAVGQLTGGLAHDFNNLLAGISGSLEMMQSRISQGRVAEIDRYMIGAQGAAKRAASLTHRLLAFSRRQTLDPKPTDVNRLVSGMEELIRRTVGPGISVEAVAKGGLWSTLVDPPQLENALLNLCINARDAMPDGGRLTIETGNRWLDDRAAAERDIPPGQYVTLCVSDNGTGMTPDVMARAFDPFFTTKPIGVGTGLGLSMIYGFARQSGGQVRIYSEVGQGTMICLYLPRHHVEEAATAPANPAAVEPTGAGETVLVIDDEPLVRMLVVDVLEDLGYAAIEAGDGPEGLVVLRSDMRLDLLITDVGLPNGMNGRQVADAARELRPGLKVMFVTGYAENAVLSHGHLDPGMQVVTKPFDMTVLANRIKAMIEAK